LFAQLACADSSSQVFPAQLRALQDEVLPVDAKGQLLAYVAVGATLYFHDLLNKAGTKYDAAYMTQSVTRRLADFEHLTKVGLLSAWLGLTSLPL